MFRVVIPHERTMSATNVPANSEAEWSSGSTYDLDDLVQVTDIPVHKVYRSLRGNNTDRYPPDHIETLVESSTSSTSIAVGTGSKTFTTQSGKGFSLGMVVKIAKTVTPNTVNMTAEITAYDSGTGSMTVSVYSVTGSGTHAGWTITTEDEIAFWEEVGATNQHAMIDEYVNTKTESTTSIDVRFPISRIDHLVLLGLVGTTVEVKVWDSGESSVLWSEEYDLVFSGAGIVNIVDWFEYFFGEYSAREDLVIPLGVISNDAVIEIIISADEGDDVACGLVVFGRKFDVGETQFGLDLGMQDFSVKETDELGRTKLEPGYWAKKADVSAFMRNSYVDSVYKRLAGLVGLPTAWIIEDEFEASIIYGVFRDFSVVIEGPSHSFCSVEIEGLI